MAIMFGSDLPLNINFSIYTKDSMSLMDDAYGNKSMYYDDDPASPFYITLSYVDEDVLVCRGIFVDESALQGDTLAEVADAFIADAGVAFSALEQSKDYMEPELENEAVINPGCIYIDRLFVSPKYRGQGISKALLNNLPEIFLHKYSFNLRYACIIIRPDAQDDIPDEEMVRIMKKTIVQNGFTDISDSKNAIYMKQYL